MVKRSDTWVGNRAGFLDIPRILTAILRTLEEIRDNKNYNEESVLTLKQFKKAVKIKKKYENGI